MKALIHKEMAFKIISDYPKKSLLTFLLNGIAKPEWKKNPSTKIKWLKEWMDMPDNVGHSKMQNDHSYKLIKTEKGFRISFINNKADQATVVARLKYDARDVIEWKQEEEYRACALELAKSIHWVIDFSSPPHTVYAYTNEMHSKLESYCDKVWNSFYDKTNIDFNSKNKIKDLYQWAKIFIETKYDRNFELLQLLKNKASLETGRGRHLIKEVIQDISQNLVDYLKYIDAKIDFDKMAQKV
jgi:hypothetical protein